MQFGDLIEQFGAELRLDRHAFGAVMVDCGKRRCLGDVRP
jgi:hypothetical protein